MSAIFRMRALGKLFWTLPRETGSILKKADHER